MTRFRTKALSASEDFLDVLRMGMGRGWVSRDVLLLEFGFNVMMMIGCRNTFDSARELCMKRLFTCPK